MLVLDPAVGTGTCLEHVITTVRATFAGNAGLWQSYAQEHLLPRLFGFERLMATYAIAHLHLATVLAGDDLPPAESTLRLDLDALVDGKGKPERLGVFLTNTLEEPVTADDTLTGFVVREANEAAAVKRDLPIVVVLGNPPYRARSSNPSYRVEARTTGKGTKTRRVNTWIGEQLAAYRQVTVTDDRGRQTTVRLGERNAQSLHDDYVKFMRFAEWRIERTGRGVLAFVTNYGYLDNATFRGMRQHLLRTFDDLYVLDLHGNPLRRATDDDENVFDIKDAGVAIALFVKYGGTPRAARTVRYHSLPGTRHYKDAWLSTHDVTTTPWTVVEPTAPEYLLKPVDTDLQKEWEQHPSLTEIFPVHGPGIKTNRDALTVHFTSTEAFKAGTEFLSLGEEQARSRLALAADSKGWAWARAHKDLSAHIGLPDAAKNLPVAVTYRPFDTRWVLWTGTEQGWLGWASTAVMRHYLTARDTDGQPTNLGLVTGRLNTTGTADHFFVTRRPTEMKTAESSRSSLTFPLYVLDGNQQLSLDTGAGPRRPNVAPSFVTALGAAVGLDWAPHDSGDLTATFGPDDVLAYVYAVLSAPGYRTRYAAPLSRDFARIPLPPDRDTFAGLVALGHRLVGLHTGSATPDVTGVTYPVPGSNRVERVNPVATTYAAPGTTDPAGQTLPTGQIWLQQPGPTAQYVAGVSPETWAFRVGGHPVLPDWLRARRGRVLSADDLAALRRTVAAVAETLVLAAAADSLVVDLLDGPA